MKKLDKKNQDSLYFMSRQAGFVSNSFIEEINSAIAKYDRGPDSIPIPFEEKIVVKSEKGVSFVSIPRLRREILRDIRREYKTRGVRSIRFNRSDGSYFELSLSEFIRIELGAYSINELRSFLLSLKTGNY